MDRRTADRERERERERERQRDRETDRWTDREKDCIIKFGEGRAGKVRCGAVRGVE